MNRTEAINLLDQPVGEVSAELRAEALSVLTGDAEATAELSERAQLDARISESLGAITPPDGLRDSILAAMLKVAAPAGAPEPEALPAEATQQRAFWLRPWALGAAAAVVLGIILWQPLQEIGVEPGGSGAQQQVAQANVASFVESLAARLSNAGPYHQQSDNMDELSSFLQVANSPVTESAGLPEKVKLMEPVGCRVLDVDGHRVSMVCMRDDAFFHLIVASADVGGSERLTRPTDFHVGDRTYVAWHQDDQLLMLVSRAPAETIHDRLAGVMASR